MNETYSPGDPKQSQLTKVAIQSLKSCPLCHAINAIGNQECFACTWSGTFDHDAEAVQGGLNDLIERCPELKQALESEQRVNRLKKLQMRLQTFKIKRPLDIRV